MPLYGYDLKDRVQHLFCACQLIEARLAKQCAVIPDLLTCPDESA
jgi:hypothetical protein